MKPGKQEPMNHKPNRKTYQIGDRIANKYEIYRILGGEGKSGMGIVYICYDHESNSVLALKTFQDKFLSSKKAKDNFKKEALSWIHLEKYPFIVRARWVQELDYRMFVASQFIAPDDQGRNTLTHYLHSPISLKQALTWSIQFCHGMEYAYSKEVTPHRDIKPDNIMITKDGMVKITDFGLAGLWDNPAISEEMTGRMKQDSKEFTFMKAAGGKIVAGTPPWMAPEQFAGTADVRSDIYSFGIVMYQMADSGRLPILPRQGDSWAIAHKGYPVSPLQDQNKTVIFSIIDKCLQKKPEERYIDFSELNNELKTLYKNEIGEILPIPPSEIIVDARELVNKGLSLYNLGLVDEAIKEYKKIIRVVPNLSYAHHNLGIAYLYKEFLDDAISEFKEALRLEPRQAIVHNALGAALNKKGVFDEAIEEIREAIKIKPDDAFARNSLAVILKERGFLDEAIHEYEEVLRLRPDYAEAHFNLGNALSDKGKFLKAIQNYKEAVRLHPEFSNAQTAIGNVLQSLDRPNEAVQYYNKAIEMDPSESSTWNNKGNSLNILCKFNQAIECFDKAIDLDSQNATTWSNKAFSLENLSQHSEALRCYDKAIELGHEQIDDIWNTKGTILNNIQHFDEAISCFDKAIEHNPRHFSAYNNKGNSFDSIGNADEAIHCYENAIELNPQYSIAWYNKGVTLMNSERFDEAIRCFGQAIQNFDVSIDPKQRLAAAWLNMALSAERINSLQQAVRAYQNFIEIAPSQYADHVAYASQRLSKLKRG